MHRASRPHPPTVVRMLLERAVALQYVERSIALGGQAFAAMIPLLIVVGSIVASDEATGDAIVKRFDLDGNAADSVRAAFVPAAAAGGALSFTSGLLLLFSALSFARTLQRLYEQTYGLPPLGLRATPSALLWIAMFGASFVVPTALGVGAGDDRAVVTAVAVNTVIWLLTPYLLLARRAGPRVLLPGALLTASAILLYTSTSTLWFPDSVASSADRFGTLGVAFSMLTWLTGAGFVVAGAATVAGTLLALRDPAQGATPLSASTARSSAPRP